MFKFFAILPFLLCSVFISFSSLAEEANPYLQQYQKQLDRAQAATVEEYQQKLQAEPPSSSPSTEEGIPNVGTPSNNKGPTNEIPSQQLHSAQENPWIKPNPWKESAKHNPWAQTPPAAPPGTTTLSPAPAQLPASDLPVGSGPNTTMPSTMTPNSNQNPSAAVIPPGPASSPSSSPAPPNMFLPPSSNPGSPGSNPYRPGQ